MLLRPVVIVAVSSCLLSVMRAGTARPNGGCDLSRSLQREIATKYPGRKVVTLPDLGEDDRGFFQKDHGNACPGLTKVDFYGDGKPTLALVLIPRDGAKGKADLVVAHQVGRNWKVVLLDTAEGPPVPVVWSQPPGKYRDVDGKREIRAARPVIVFTGYESWAIVYAWTGKSVSKVWIAD